MDCPKTALLLLLVEEESPWLLMNIIMLVLLRGLDVGEVDWEKLKKEENLFI